MSDILDRLRGYNRQDRLRSGIQHILAQDYHDAITEIERLRSESVEADICMAWATGEISGGRAREIARGVSTWDKMVDRLNLALERCGCGKDRWSELWHDSRPSTTTDQPKSSAPTASSCPSSASPDSSPRATSAYERTDALAEITRLRAEVAALCEHRDVLAYRGVEQERDEARAQLEVSRQIGDTFWLALKPLNLPAINVANPGQHVTDLIAERDALKAEVEQLRKDQRIAMKIGTEDMETITADRARLAAEFSIMARACGNWREWPDKAHTDHDHPDWKAAARAIIERDALAAKCRPLTLENVRDQLAEADAMFKELHALRADRARLAEIVERLPKTADGVPVAIGMRFWTLDDLEVDDEGNEYEGWIVTGIGPEVAADHQHYDWVRTNGIGYLTTTAIYSTRAAAESARAEKPPQQETRP